MSEVEVASSRVRPAMQKRSRRGWEQILEAGAWILENEGRDRLTIANVCDRAGVAPTALYRRVDGLAGLFWAIYDRGMTHIIHTYRSGLAAAESAPAGSPTRVTAVVTAVADTFEQHQSFLHEIVNYSTVDAALRERGSRESLELVELVEGLLPRPDESAAREVARLLHQECTFRAMYGDSWLSRQPESFDAFVARLDRLARARLGFGPA